MATADIPLGYDKPLKNLLDDLKTDSTRGLKEEEAGMRLLGTGPNIIPVVKGSFWQVYLAPLFDWLISTYLVMTGALLVLSLWDPSVFSQASFWLVIVGINFAIAIVQQARAQKKMDALQKLSAPTSKVIRDGETQEVPAEQLVPGDIINLQQGDKIPADSRIIKSSNLLVNESSLTGESIPVEKAEKGEEALDPNTPISERSNMVYNGSYVEVGTAIAVVVNTGVRTELGKISQDLSELNTGEIPLRRKINVLGRYLAMAMLIFLAIQIVYKGYILYEDDKLDSQSKVAQELALGVITSMSIMPINIPLLTTIVLLTGVLAMASHRVLISNLAAVESLGRVSVLCSDKTGTITYSQMTVKRIWDGNYLYGVSGLGYGPTGEIRDLILIPTEAKAQSTIPQEYSMAEDFAMATMNLAYPGSSLEVLLVACYLNNDAKVLIDEMVGCVGCDATWRAIGDPTDAALVTLFNKSSLDREEIEGRYNLLRELPFDSRLKRMSKVFLDFRPGISVFSKGATEVILPRCTKIGAPYEQSPLTEKQRQMIQEFTDDHAELGFRVLSVAYKQYDDFIEVSELERDEIESDLTYLGFVCLLDPPREGVRQSVEECLSAGITPIMITGDAPATAGTIAENVKIVEPDQKARVRWGHEAESLNDDDFEKTRVFARVAPKDKQVIVERYQNKDRVVAMTGDGVNDALALSMADAGVVMGISGTDVAKQAADIIITDDSFNSIVTGIRQGRNLFQKIRMMIFFYICINLAEALLYFGATFFLDGAILDNWQRVYIFSLAHGLPPMAMIFDRSDKGIMEREPLDGEGIFNKNLLLALFVTALALSSMLYLVFYLTYNEVIPVVEFNRSGIDFSPSDWYSDDNIVGPDGWKHAKARTMLLTTIFFCECPIVLSFRRMNKSILSAFTEDRFWLVYFCVFLLPIAHIVLMYFPPFQEILVDYTTINLELIFLTPLDWVICIGAAMLPIAALEGLKAYKRTKGEYF
ncbi:MAG: cation-translocating P-type ATPase [Candidatus Thorarchaeota archaeon]